VKTRRRNDLAEGEIDVRDVNSHPTDLPELSWLSEVTESRQPLSELCPIWVRHGTITEGPPIPHPERHPYCEFGILTEGRGISFVEREHAERIPGDVFLAGPGVPHWGRLTQYPARFITIYFLPSILIELGPANDGPRILQRFTSSQSLNDRLVRPHAELRRKLIGLFEAIVLEFENHWFGREVKLRTLLMEQLVELLRWEERLGRRSDDEVLAMDWRPINKALHYLRDHYTEPIYARNVARAAGVSEPRMKELFRHALGMSWVKYLQGYRIHRAAALLGESGSNVTEAAFAAGFESISHFNAIFRTFMGVSPSEYAKQSLIKKRR
jgi:AraC-like DNA-binding protein